MSKRNAIILLIAVMLVWGSSYAVTKAVVDTVPPALLAFTRFLIASVIMLPFYIKQQKSETTVIGPNDYYLLGLMGATGVCGYFLLFNYALIFTSASSGALIQGALPVCIALSGIVMLKEKVLKTQLAGILLSCCGVALVASMTSNGAGSGSSPLLGNMLMLASVFCWTAYTLISRKLNKIPSFNITFFSTVFGTIFLVPFAYREYLLNPDILIMSWGDWMSILYLAIFSSVLGNLFYNKALENLPAATVGNFLNLDILVGVAIAVVFLNEQVTVSQLIGGALILSGLFLSSK